MLSIHENFNIFQEIENVLGKKGAFISEQTPDRSKFLKWIKIAPLRQLFYQFFTSWDMAREVIRSKKVHFIFIYEHKPQYSLLLYITCIIKHVPCFFIVHGIQQTQSRSLFHKAGIKLLFFFERRFNFWPIHIELGDEVLAPAFRFRKSLITLHPLPEKLMPRTRKFNSSKISIGIVGMLRGDKPIMPLLNQLESIVARHLRYELVVGTPFWQLSEELKVSSVTLVDTSSPAQYADLLRSIDIIVTSFDEKSFYFRPSGIINDALAAGSYVIAPDFPVLRAQMSFPAKVGAVYNSFDQIEMLIEEAIVKLEAHDIEFENWRQFRSRDTLVNAMSEKIRNIIANSD